MKHFRAADFFEIRGILSGNAPGLRIKTTIRKRPMSQIPLDQGLKIKTLWTNMPDWSVIDMAATSSCQ